MSPSQRAESLQKHPVPSTPSVPAMSLCHCDVSPWPLEWPATLPCFPPTEKTALPPLEPLFPSLSLFPVSAVSPFTPLLLSSCSFYLCCLHSLLLRGLQSTFLLLLQPSTFSPSLCSLPTFTSPTLHAAKSSDFSTKKWC